MIKSYTSLSKRTTHIEGDQHRLVGQILDNRLRVLSLNHVSPRQWLYQVEPPSVGKTRRALKVLGDPLSREPGSYYRLKTSYHRLKQITSPYLERSYECGLLHDHTPYIVVEWEPHQSLYEYLRLQKTPLSWRDSQQLFIGICQGLNALHESGVAHGDLRPQHVLLRHPPRSPVLIDGCINAAFGSPPVPGLDHSGSFWAPERKSLSTASPSADLYSLGALMYFCLNGTPPFNILTSQFNDQDSEQLASPLRCIESAHDDLEPPESMGDEPQEIKSLIAQLLAKSPRQRPTTQEVLKCLAPNGVDPLLVTTVSTSPKALNIDPSEASKKISSESNEETNDKTDDLLELKPPLDTYNAPVWLISALCSIGALIGLTLAKW